MVQAKAQTREDIISGIQATSEEVAKAAGALSEQADLLDRTPALRAAKNYLEDIVNHNFRIAGSGNGLGASDLKVAGKLIAPINQADKRYESGWSLLAKHGIKTDWETSRGGQLVIDPAQPDFSRK